MYENNYESERWGIDNNKYESWLKNKIYELSYPINDYDEPKKEEIKPPSESERFYILIK